MDSTGRPAQLALVSLAVLALSACGSDTERAQAADPSIPVTDVTRGEIIAMPGAFADVATGCYGTTRVFVSATVGGSSGRDVAVVPDDPTCEARR